MLNTKDLIVEGPLAAFALLLLGIEAAPSECLLERKALSRQEDFLLGQLQLLLGCILRRLWPELLVFDDNLS